MFVEKTTSESFSLFHCVQISENALVKMIISVEIVRLQIFLRKKPTCQMD